MKRSLNQFRNVIDGKTNRERILSCEYLIIGSGAGGGHAFSKLVDTGADVLLIEEGPLYEQADFSVDEYEMYKNLYQDQSTRTTADKGIRILQGRNVGGSTTVNWTTSLRAPESTLETWKQTMGSELVDEIEKNYENMEKQYHIKKWKLPANENNLILKKACEKKGWDYAIIPRNVKGCVNSGLCGLGCPFNAKVAPLTKNFPEALAKGGRLLYNTKAIKLTQRKGEISKVLCENPDGKYFEIYPKKVIFAAGSIGTPGLILKSGIDLKTRVGERTFLHPTVMSASFHGQKIEGAKGAPQSIYSNHFLQESKDYLGFKLEMAPIYPAIYAGILPFAGKKYVEYIRKRPYSSAMIALIKDGFEADSMGGKVLVNPYGDYGLDYPISTKMWKSFQHALLTMASAQFSVGAQEVKPGVHTDKLAKSPKEAKDIIEQSPLKHPYYKIFSAHVMGGMGIGKSNGSSVDLSGKVRGLKNAYVLDGSLFPTSIGSNPMLSIYALTEALLARM